MPSEPTKENAELRRERDAYLALLLRSRTTSTTPDEPGYQRLVAWYVGEIRAEAGLGA